MRPRRRDDDHRLTGQSTKVEGYRIPAAGREPYPWDMVRLVVATAVENGSVLMLITVIVLPIAALARSGEAWRGIGRGPYAIDPDLPPRSVRRLPSPIGEEMREAEVRQMIEAKSFRRQRRGEAPLDVEAETERRLADRLGSD